MISFVVATHGTFSDGLLNAAELIMGKIENIKTLNLLHGDDIEKFHLSILDAIHSVNQNNEGIIIFTDLAGASPYNQATLAIQHIDDSLKHNIYVVSGVNLPLLIEAVNHQYLGTNIHDVANDLTNIEKIGIDSWHISKLKEFTEEDSEDDF